ncbi:MAG: flagellar basal body L-ring protein FlgH [Nitrospirae bacterium]|jgi:flagellar L-ring protein precursor FlgH|nr:flagellar basal body L-ring protein FlgH [Nitrospirota bacterium]
MRQNSPLGLLLVFVFLSGCAPAIKIHYPVVTDRAPRRLPPHPVQQYFDGSLYRPDGIADLASDQNARFRGETVWIRIPVKNGLPGFPQDRESLMGAVVVREAPPDELVVFAHRTVRRKNEVRRWILEGRIRREDIGYDNTIPVRKLSMARYRYDHRQMGQKRRFQKNRSPLPASVPAVVSNGRSNGKSGGNPPKTKSGPPPIQGGGGS